MRKLQFVFFAVIILSPFAFGQKGIDSQTQKIQSDSNKTVSRPNDVNRTWTWGDKTKIRPRLDNPLKLNSRRDVLIENIIEILKEKKIIVDEASSRLSDGIIITQPYIFARGAVITRNEIARYAILPNSDTVWTRGRYTLTIEVQSIDGVQNNVFVTAKVEGLSGSGLGSEWTTLQSSGQAEEEFLTKLVEVVTGVSPDEPQDN